MWQHTCSVKGPTAASRKSLGTECVGRGWGRCFGSFGTSMTVWIKQTRQHPTLSSLHPLPPVRDPFNNNPTSNQSLGRFRHETPRHFHHSSLAIGLTDLVLSNCIDKDCNGVPCDPVPSCTSTGNGQPCTCVQGLGSNWYWNLMEAEAIEPRNGRRSRQQHVHVFVQGLRCVLSHQLPFLLLVTQGISDSSPTSVSIAPLAVTNGIKGHKLEYIKRVKGRASRPTTALLSESQDVGTNRRETEPPFTMQHKCRLSGT